NRTGFFDQSEARATRQAPSIRVHHAGHDAHHILHLNRVHIWLAGHHPCMPLERRETEDWLRHVVQHVCVLKRVVEYPSTIMKETSTTEQSSLTNHKPEPHVWRLPSESTTLATPLIICCTSLVSFSGWLLIFLACHWEAESQRIG
uniref:GPS domain-containing protein n=1 Tax=Mesocestoides corti TaxID=53468 RepID=A0A5K3EHC0_MESCO